MDETFLKTLNSYRKKDEEKNVILLNSIPSMLSFTTFKEK